MSCQVPSLLEVYFFTNERFWLFGTRVWAIDASSCSAPRFFQPQRSPLAGILSDLGYSLGA